MHPIPSKTSDSFYLGNRETEKTPDYYNLTKHIHYPYSCKLVSSNQRWSCNQTPLLFYDQWGSGRLTEICLCSLTIRTTLGDIFN